MVEYLNRGDAVVLVTRKEWLSVKIYIQAMYVCENAETPLIQVAAEEIVGSLRDQYHEDCENAGRTMSFAKWLLQDTPMEEESIVFAIEFLEKCDVIAERASLASLMNVLLHEEFVAVDDNLRQIHAA